MQNSQDKKYTLGALKRNYIKVKLKCMKCGQIVENESLFDYVLCGCDNYLTIDCSYDGTKISAEDIDDVRIYDETLKRFVKLQED